MWESKYTRNAFVDESSYLAHHGILGQKWGVRRFQNEDGTLTNAGKKRYGSGDSESKPMSRREQKKADKAKQKAEEKDAAELKRKQEEWDKNASENWYLAWNATADICNAKIDDFNAEWDRKAEKLFGKNGKWSDKFQEEYETAFYEWSGAEYEKQFKKMFGDRPE